MTETICYDVETGSLCPYTGAICSITLKKVGEPIIKTIYIKPTQGREYSPKALEINGLTLQELEEKGVTEKQAIQQVITFVIKNFNSKPNMLAHNIVFDIQFMNALFKRNDYPLFSDLCYYHPKDTMIMASMLKDAGIINFPKVNLQTCYKTLFGKPFENAHTSEADVLATEQIYKKMKQILGETYAKQQMVRTNP